MRIWVAAHEKKGLRVKPLKQYLSGPTQPKTPAQHRQAARVALETLAGQFGGRLRPVKKAGR